MKDVLLAYKNKNLADQRILSWISDLYFGRHQYHMAAKFDVFIDNGHEKLPKMYVLP